MNFIFDMFGSKENTSSHEDINFDDYLPVFLYSHASFPELEESCKVADIKVSGEVSEEGKFKTLKTIDDFFMKVPENMVVVDPIPSGLLCMSGYAVDDLFPWFISVFGSNTFLNKSKLPVQHFKNDENVSGKELDALQSLYNNRKLYYPEESINNYRIAFDTNEGSIPWGIRIPIYKNKINGEGWDDTEKYTEENLDMTNGIDIKLVHPEFSRQYSTKNNYQCIYLNEVMIKIKEYVKEIYGENKKIALYLISCRKQPLQENMDEEFHKELLNRQLQVDTLGRQNVPKGLTTDRKTRGMETFVYDDEEENYDKLLTDISIKSRAPKKRRVRKRQITPPRKTKRSVVVGGKSVKKKKTRKSVKKKKTRKSVKKRVKKY